VAAPGAARNQDADARVAVLAGDLTSRQVCKRFKATRGLAVLGPQAKAASRALCQALLDRSADVRLGAAAALKKVNPTMYQWVIPLLVDPEPNNHAEPLNQLTRLGREGNPAVPVLLPYQQQYGGPAVIETLAAVAANDSAVTARFAAWLAQATDGTKRLAIARALPPLADGRGPVGALVLALSTDRSEPVRLAAAHALGELGRDARAAQGALSRLQTDPSAAVREAAAKALEKVQDDR
jgi:HEAT repeat protein